MAARFTKLLLCLLGIAMLGVLVVAAIWPLVEQQLMRVPLADGVTALRNGKLSVLRQCFTPGAVIAIRERTLSLEDVLASEPELQEGKTIDSPVRLGDLTHIQRHGRTADADITVIVDLQGDDMPYRSIPLQRTMHVVLERQSLFVWKIQRVDANIAGLSP
jgi:hypothetical protein